MFKKILIANRGEIACRVMKTAAAMGIKTVAVYSDADKDALHVEMADEAVHIGPPPARESYLDADKIIAVAKSSGADAIHPGYGFLSENADFAQKAADAGIVFIGPPPSAIRAMGGKSESKALMEDAKVPLVPGYHGEDQDAKLLKREAERIGFPVLIKASAGGGGKGMRVVNSADEFDDALAGAKREGAASFGSDKVLVEKYLAAPRHVEIQVFSDTHGNHVYLMERDCSVQRRHQKVIEEAPAPGLSPATRKAMGEAAVNAARAIGYVGAGTVEFLLDSDGTSFYFMEMNTRLQVEHPVTEMITGYDLVEWQLRVASGEHLPAKQDDISITGHALEARIYAEDPMKNFLPSPGTIGYLSFPVEENGVRVDTGVRETVMGETQEISSFYDPMIAKLIIHADTRTAALEKMADALKNVRIAGLQTNTAFLSRLVANPDFATAKLDTKFIDRHSVNLLPDSAHAAPQNALALAAVAIARGWHDVRRFDTASSPWARVNGWRMNYDHMHALSFTQGETKHTAGVTLDGADYLVTLADGVVKRVSIAYPSDVGFVGAIDGGVETHFVAYRTDAGLTVLLDGVSYDIGYQDPQRMQATDTGGGARLTAPMPGKIVAVHVEVGANVKKGQPLVILEAMKMEHTISAPKDGVIGAIRAKAGEQVKEGLELVSYAADAA